MALGGKKGNVPDGKLYVMRIRIKDENDVDLIPAVFQVSQKDDTGKWTKLAKTEQKVNGDIIKVELGEGEWEKTKYKTVKVYLHDTEVKETYLLDLRYSNLSRNLFNALAALTNFKDVSVSLYKTKSKKNDKEYSNISLWQNEELIKGKFKLDEIPKPEEIIDKKGVVIKRDFSEADDLFEKELKEVVLRVTAANKTVKKVKTDTPPATSESDENADVQQAADKDLF